MNKPAKREYRQWIEDVLERSPLRVMTEAGFRKRGMVFTRLAGGVKQVVRFELLVRPRYARDSAQLVILVDTCVPDADGIHAESLRDVPDALTPYFVRQDAETLRKPQRGLWLFADKPQAEALEKPLAEALTDDVIPYLEDRSSIASFAARCESEVLLHVHRHGPFVTDRPVYVAALLSVAGHEDRAREILDKAYPVGSRGRSIFEPVVNFYADRQ